MNALLLVAAQNSFVTLVFALVVYGLTRAVRNPPLAHALWLLVLIKLVTPPLMPVDWSLPVMHGPAFNSERSPDQSSLSLQDEDGRKPPQPAAQQRADGLAPDNEGGGVEHVAARPTVREPTVAAASPGKVTAFLRQFSLRPAPVLFGCWMGGVALCALLTSLRTLRFERALREMLPASASLERLALETAGKLGVRRVPLLRCTDSVEVPLLWCVLHPTIVLPMRLLRQFDERQVALILAHELAHLRRRDHWVRAVEVVVSIIYWWNPLVWLIRRQIHQAEDSCCDAWVRRTFPDERKRYAELLLKTAESLSSARFDRRLLPASPFLRSFLLKERIEMILESRFKPQVSRRSKLLIALVAVLVLPAFFRLSKHEVAAQDEKQTPATASKADTPTQPEFPHSVKFEQGATKFLDGDKITVVEVRGTAETFKPGEIYWIKGTYTLGSHDRASLAAYTTAKNAAEGTGKTFTAQTTTVNKGSGNFTLFLPMACEGWPHVSFYPVEGGEGFGGNYFGTGDSVLKRWWGAKDDEAPAKNDKPATKGQTSHGQWRAFGRVTDAMGQPLPEVEILAHCGNGTLRNTGRAISEGDGRYELVFGPGILSVKANGPTMQAAMISARKAGYFEENLNRQGGCGAADAMPDEDQLKGWNVSKDRVFLPDRPLEIDFVMRPAAKAAGRLVDEQGQPLVGYSVALASPATNVVSNARTDEQGRFVLEDIPTTFRYQFTVRQAKPKPPWNDSWASAAVRFDRTDKEDLRAWFGDREVRVDEFVLRVVGEGVHGKTATRLAGNAGKLDLTVDNPDDVLEKSDGRLAATAATLTLSNSLRPDFNQSLVRQSVPADPAVAFPTRLARSQPNEEGEFVISFENPPGFELTRGKHQVIFQVFVGASQKPIRERIFRQLDIEEGRYEVPVKISPELIDDSRVSITFVTIQPDHDAWVKAFFDEGKGTTYRGLWTSDGDVLPAVPFAMARQN